jgi:hypothetical protein
LGPGEKGYGLAVRGPVLRRCGFVCSCSRVLFLIGALTESAHRKFTPRHGTLLIAVVDCEFWAEAMLGSRFAGRTSEDVKGSSPTSPHSVRWIRMLPCQRARYQFATDPAHTEYVNLGFGNSPRQLKQLGGSVARDLLRQELDVGGQIGI